MHNAVVLGSNPTILGCFVNFLVFFIICYLGEWLQCTVTVVENN